MNPLEGTKQTGKFGVRKGKSIYGELTLNGADTLLYLQDKNQLDTRETSGGYIHGVLTDFTRVSLLNCFTSGTGASYGLKERYYSASVFPNFVIHGDKHLAPKQQVIEEVFFEVDDAAVLFHDFSVFGMALDARPHMKQILRADARKVKVINPNAPKRTVATGADPLIFYFTGKSRIITANTELGTISAFNFLNYSHPDPTGIRVKNTITVSIAFKEAIGFEEALIRVRTLVRFLELLIGRPQNVTELRLRIRSRQKMPVLLSVYCSLPLKRDRSGEWKSPDFIDVLLLRNPGHVNKRSGKW